MKRYKISAKKHGRSFGRKRRYSKAINSPRSVMRGGIRL